MGLVNSVFTGGDFEDQCKAKAREWVGRPSVLAKYTKALFYSFREEELSKYLDRECEIVRHLWRALNSMDREENKILS